MNEVETRKKRIEDATEKIKQLEKQKQDHKKYLPSSLSISQFSSLWKVFFG